MSTFALVTHGSDGDVLPFVRIGADLVRKGHRVTLLTHAPYRNAAIEAGIDFVAIDDEIEFERTLAATSQLLGSGGGRVSWVDFYRRFGLFDQIRLECDALLRLQVPGDTVFVGRHTSGVSARFVAELTNAPVAWVALSPIQVMAVPIAAHTYGTELAGGFDQIRTGLGLPPLRDWGRWFADSDVEIALWPSWFDVAGHSSPRRVRLTDFPLADHPDVDATLPDLPDGVRPVLATGGTGRMLHSTYYPVLIDALARTGMPALLAVRHRDLLPRRLPPNIRWYERLPFANVMPRVAVAVHHGGIGTCVRAMAAGTPQVLLADGIDRPDNAARLSRHGLARSVPREEWTGETIAAEIRAAALDGTYRERVATVTGGSLDGGTEAAVALLTAMAGSGRRAIDSTVRRLDALSSAERQRLRERLEHRLQPQQRQH